MSTEKPECPQHQQHSHHYHHQLQPPDGPIRTIEVLDALESRLAYVPGGRDRQGRPLVVLDIPSVGEPSPITKFNLEKLLRYFFSSVFSEETISSRGLCVIVDARSTTWRTARSYIRLAAKIIEDASGDGTHDHRHQHQLIALRPEAGFWDKRVDNCTKSQREFAELATCLPLSKLTAHVEPDQLPGELGGTSRPHHDHATWLQNRLRAEDYACETEALLIKMHESIIIGNPSEEAVSCCNTREFTMNEEVASAAQRILHTGKNLMNALSQESTAQDVLDTIQRLRKLIDAIEQKQLEIIRTKNELERTAEVQREIRALEEGVAEVTNWILGPADTMLNSHYQIGFDVASSEEFRREHEQLELDCRDTYGKYAELLHRIDSLPANLVTEDLKSQRDFMDFVCRSFATRLERRRNVLITSQRFFRHVSEYFDRTSEVFDKLIMGTRSCSFAHAGAKLQKLEKSQRRLESLERELVKEGEKLSDILSMPVKDALCRDVEIDYVEDIINVKDILDATNARKNIFNDSVELQKLTLKQFALIHTYESDAEQAVQWLDDLFDVLVEEHVEIGCNATEIQVQKQEHQTFQETAKGTYDYGCQLINGARVLRISCKLELHGNTALLSRLRYAWRQLRSVGQEQLTRLRVCAVFHRNVEDHCAKLQEMIDTVSSSPRIKNKTVATSSASSGSATSTPATSKSNSPVDAVRARAEIRDILVKREELLPEVGRMVRLGRLLRSRLKEPLVHQRMSAESEENSLAVQSISEKLLEVTRLAEKLDAKLCEAGARSQPLDPGGDLEEGNAVMPKRSTTEGVAAKCLKHEYDKGLFSKNLFELKRKTLAGSPKPSPVPPEIIRSQDPQDDSTSVVSEYVTATECSTTPIARSRNSSESFISCEYEDASCRILEEESSKTSCSEPIHRSDHNVTRSSLPVSGEFQYTPDSATVIQRMLQDKSGKIVREVTETTTLRVTHDTRFGIASYKMISNTFNNNNDYVDLREIQDLKKTLIREESDENNSSSTCSSTGHQNSSAIYDVRSEESVFNHNSRPNGFIKYQKSVATEVNPAASQNSAKPPSDTNNVDVSKCSAGLNNNNYKIMSKESGTTGFATISKDNESDDNKVLNRDAGVNGHREGEEEFMSAVKMVSVDSIRNQKVTATSADQTNAILSRRH